MEGPQSAHLPPCRLSRRRSLHPTENSHSGLAAGTSLHAPEATLPLPGLRVLGGLTAVLRQVVSRRLSAEAHQARRWQLAGSTRNSSYRAFLLGPHSPARGIGT